MLQFNVRRLTQSSSELDFAAARPATGGSSGLGQFRGQFALRPFGFHHAELRKFQRRSVQGFRLYAQDTYRLSSKLTLNYGLRYDIDLPASEALVASPWWIPHSPTPMPEISLGLTPIWIWRRTKRTEASTGHLSQGFRPAAGICVQHQQQTVIRGGYGIYYEALKEGSFADQDGLGFSTARLLPRLTADHPDRQWHHAYLPPTGPLPGWAKRNGGVIYVPANSGGPRTFNLESRHPAASHQYLMVSVAYVGSKGTHLPALNIIPNQTNPSMLPFLSTFSTELTVNSSCLAGAHLRPQCPGALPR